MIADKIKNARTIKNLHRNRLLKISMFPGRLFLTGKMVFPKQKDIKKQPMFTCLQTKEYCY